MACTDCVLWLTTWFFLWQAGRVPSECTSWRKEQLRGCLVPHSVAAESKPPGQGQLTSLCRSFESSLSHRTLWFPWLCPCPYLAAANTLKGSLCHCPQKRRSQRLLHKMPHLLAAASPSCAHESQGVLCIFIQKSLIREPGSREQSLPFPSHASRPNFHFLVLSLSP